MNAPTVPPGSILSFAGVTFGYGHAAPLLRDVSFAIGSGELVGLLGPNGAGKTTLLRLATGALTPQRGSVRFAGQTVATLGRRALAQAIAVVPQELTMPFAYTVRQMVEMGRTPHLSPLGWGTLGTADHDAVTSAMAATAVTDLAERNFNELSGGERQRVLVALALAQSPRLLLLDEPTAHLDIHHQIEVLELVARLNREAGLTVLASLHDLNLAARYFPRLILWQRGIVADGPPSTALDPALLGAVYGLPVQVGILRGARHLSVLPPTGDAPAGDATARAAVHVIAGGGTGDLVMRLLAEDARPFTAGPLNIGDSDYALADQLALHTITEPPYAPVSAVGQAAALAAMARVGNAILCPIPLGGGNVALLAAAGEALAAGVRVWLFEPSLPPPTDTPLAAALAAHVAERDYTGGAGAAAYADLVRAGAVVLTNLPDLRTALLAAIPAKLA